MNTGFTPIPYFIYELVKLLFHEKTKRKNVGKKLKKCY